MQKSGLFISTEIITILIESQLLSNSIAVGEFGVDGLWDVKSKLADYLDVWSQRSMSRRCSGGLRMNKWEDSEDT